MSKTGTAAPLSFTWECVGDVVVSLALPGEVDDAAWSGFPNDVKTKKARAILAFAAGKNSLTATQRKVAADVLKAQQVLGIVITDSALTRGLVTAVSWLGANAKAFSWGDLEAALRLLQMPKETERRVRDIIADFEKLRKEAPQ